MKTLVMAVTFCFLCAPALAQDTKIRKFTESVYLMFMQGNASLVVIGDEGVLVTDPSDPPRARLLKAEIAKLTDKPVSKIVLSHEHTDHVGGTEVFEKAEIIAQSSVKSVFMLDPTGLVPKKVDVYFDTEYTIDMGTTRVELRHYGAADGHASIVVYLPKESIVLTADLYPEAKKELLDLPPGYSANLVGIRRIFHEISKWKPKYVLNAHLPDSDPELMYQYARFIDDLYDAVYPHLEKLFHDSAKMWEEVQGLPEKITLPAYKDWGNYRYLPGYVNRMAYSIGYGA